MKMRIILDSIRSCISIRRHPALRCLLLAAGLVASAAVPAEPGEYQSTDAFVAEAFPGATPDAQAIWLRAGLREAVTEILGHPPAPRVRYWQHGARTVWILEEIGKDEPITAGVVVRDGAIEDIRVLVFRESRGWEVKYPFFTRQFQEARLTRAGELDQPIDGITGATLSVRAMTRMARAALVLDAHARGTVSELARVD